MKRIHLFYLIIFLACACKQQEGQTSADNTTVHEMGVENWSKKTFMKPKAHDILREWKEFIALETSFDALYNVANREDLSLVLDDIIEDYKSLEKSKYPVEFNIPQIKSRQKVFYTYVLKAKGDLHYRVDHKESVEQMIAAYNAFRNQFNIEVSNTLDTNLILDF